MSGSGPGASGSPRVGSAPTRLIRVWRALPHERRLAALAAVGLFLTLFLPWYQETVIAGGVSKLQSFTESLTGWGAFSFVEAAVLLVAAGVLVLLFVRAEGRAFHVPGGDGGVITAAGFWTCVLIVWRMFDKQGTSGHGQFATTSGIEWGIFIALGVAAFLTYAGTRIRLAHEPEPPLPGEARSPPVQRSGGGFWRRKSRSEPRPRAAESAPARGRRGPEMDMEDAWTEQLPARRAREPEPPPPPRTPEPEPPPPPRTPEPEPPPPPSEAATRVIGSPHQPAPEPDAGHRRVRPRSVGAPEPDGRPGRPDRDPPAAGDPDRDRSAGPEPRARGGFDRREIQDLDIAGPPTARLGRSAPKPDLKPEAHREPPPEPEDPSDQRTIRLDRPN
jgi:hypothetical protein